MYRLCCFPWCTISIITAAIGFREVLTRVTPVTMKDFGYMAIVYDDRLSHPIYVCTGILITNKIVLSTCECIGRFSYDTISLNLKFTPIDWKQYRVRLGYDGRGSSPIDCKIKDVKQYEKCSLGKISNFIHNLGAITLEHAVIISEQTSLSLAPALLEPTQDAMEARVLDMIYNEEYCTIVGFGSSSNGERKLQSVRTRFSTFLKCSGRVCLNPNECLKNVDIANNEEMCASAKNDSENCSADQGSPMLCDKRLTGIVNFVSCNNSNTPILLTRLGAGICQVFADPPVVEVEIKNYGFMAVVIEKVPGDGNNIYDHFRCSGLLISPEVVFTTCSCIGTFSFFRGVYVEFTPISFEVFQVLLGVDDLGIYALPPDLHDPDNNYYIPIRIESVIPHRKCSWDRIVGYKFNWGAIVMEVAVKIQTPLSLAPPLLRETSSALETETLKRIIKEQTCYVLGYRGFDLIEIFGPYHLRRIEVKFITFMDCNRRVHLRVTGDRVLRNIDIANSGDMCLSAKNESENCFADLGSPLLCDGKLTGIVTFRQNCQDRPSPMLAARLEGTVDFYYGLFGGATAAEISRKILVLMLTSLYGLH